MSNFKTGTSMGGIIITKKAKELREFKLKRSSGRKKRATICLNCEHNDEGYCRKHIAWCGRVNYICLGIKNPYGHVYYNNKQFKKRNKKRNKRK